MTVQLKVTMYWLLCQWCVLMFFQQIPMHGDGLQDVALASTAIVLWFQALSNQCQLPADSQSHHAGPSPIHC
jgi:hypothetical protein